MQRDFTYIDDIANGIIKTVQNPSQINQNWDGENPDPATSGVAPYRVYNIGNNKPVELMTYINLLEKELGIEAEKNMLPMQAGDVPATWADCSELIENTGYIPKTSVEEGIKKFVQWYKEFYKV
jgi:UDP-glucuronate 4-epimerase